MTKRRTRASIPKGKPVWNRLTDRPLFDVKVVERDGVLVYECFLCSDISEPGKALAGHDGGWCPIKKEGTGFK